VSQLSTKCGGLDVSQLYGPARPVTGINLSFASKNRNARNFVLDLKGSPYMAVVTHLWQGQTTDLLSSATSSVRFTAQSERLGLSLYTENACIQEKTLKLKEQWWII
jgi:hypothetical protein